MGMLREERIEELNEALRYALQGLQSRMWTALPGIIQTVDLPNRKCNVQIAIQAQVRNTDNTYSWIDIAQLLDCPLIFPQGGGYTLTFPIAAGDECLVIFSSRCIDSWWAQGGHANTQAELRMHDLSDGFALAGPSSIPNLITNISANSVQLRSNDGQTFIDLKDGQIKATPDGGETLLTLKEGEIDVTAAKIVLHAPAEFAWDVNGYGQTVSFVGTGPLGVWTVTSYTTPGSGQTVTPVTANITPPGPNP